MTMWKLFRDDEKDDEELILADPEPRPSSRPETAMHSEASGSSGRPGIGYSWDGLRLLRNKKRPPDTPSEPWRGMSSKRRHRALHQKMELIEEEKRKERERERERERGLRLPCLLLMALFQSIGNG